MADADQVAWYDVWGQLNRAATDLDAAVAALQGQRAYALARPDLGDAWQAKMDEIASARGRVAWLRDTIRSVLSFFGVQLQGLGFLPLVPIALVTAGVAYIANLASSAWELSKNIEEQRRLESGGLSPQQASAIVRSTAQASGGAATSMKTWAIVGGVAFLALFVLPKFLPGKR